MQGCTRHQVKSTSLVHISCLFTAVCLLFATAMYVSCPLSAVSTEMGERSFRLEFSPHLSSSTQTRCVLLGLHPTTHRPNPRHPLPHPTPPAPPPTLCSPFLKSAVSVRPSLISSEAWLQGWTVHCCCCCPCGLWLERCPWRFQVRPLHGFVTHTR